MPRPKSPASVDPGSPEPTLAQPVWVKRVVVAHWGRVNAEAFQAVCRRAFPEARILACTSGAETLSTLRTHAADVLYLNMSLPDMDGGDVLQCVTDERLATRVLVASHRRDEQCLRTLRDARFDGLIDSQDEGLETLLRAFHLVATGSVYVSPNFRSNVIDREPLGVVWQKLTAAEFRVFAAIGDGSSNQEAASRLGLSTATVQTHRRNLMHKIGISSSAKLVVEAIRLGLVRITDEGRVIRPGFEVKRRSLI